MRNKKRIDNVKLEDMSSTGKAIARIDGQVVFVDKGVPGDVVDILVYKKKKSFMEARILQTHSREEWVIEPRCNYFGTCGGCKWQNINYEHQLQYKTKQVTDSLERIGKVQIPAIDPIVAGPELYYYRNKLEYTFSNKKWLTYEEMDASEERFVNGLGFHIPGQFDKVLHIDECHLQINISNEIRNFIYEFAIENDYTFYDIRKHHGLLRNLIVRTSSTGDLMVILQVGEIDPDRVKVLLKALTEKFTNITSCFYIENTKMNDSYGDLFPIHFSGKDHILESMANPNGKGQIKYRVGPKSFYQTNSRQAEVLYKLTWEMAQIDEGDIVYDLYTGTGTIANYVAEKAKKVVGLEYVEEAVQDAAINAKLNEYNHLSFFSGDMKDLLTEEFIERHGKPSVVITDPPRAGMHESVTNRLLDAEPDRIVYVSCNPATQARDIEILSSKYEVKRVQPVDMFPHTPHVENIVLLVRK